MDQNPSQYGVTFSDSDDVGLLENVSKAAKGMDLCDIPGSFEPIEVDFLLVDLLDQPSNSVVQYWSRVIAHFTRAYDIASASKSLASKSPMIYAHSVWPYAQGGAYDLRASTID